ncbi:hypothetical protein BH09BAC4_BH09BAC4_06190 [soil metagenome]
MAKSIQTASSLGDELAYYLAPIDLGDLLPLNVGLGSAQQATMISTLGPPRMPLTTVDQPDHVSPSVKKLLQTVQLSQHVVATGIHPALDSLKHILSKAFQQEAALNHDLESVLSTAGMLNVRLRKPTHGPPSTKISNHAWGTAIDFKLVGHSPPGDTAHVVPRFIAVLIPFFHAEGWFSGIGFQDAMHFEVAEGTMHQWAKKGLFS